MKKEYIGDGVYIAPDDNGFVLTVEDGIKTTNAIYLEFEHVEMINDYIQRIRKENGQ